MYRAVLSIRHTYFRPINGVEGKGKPWCYIADPSSNKDLEECDVPMCETPAQEVGDEPAPTPAPPVTNTGTYSTIT